MTPSETPGHGRARGSARNTREMRLATLTLLLPLYVAVGFATNFIGALHDPKPHHVKVAIVGAPAATAPLARAIGDTPTNGFAVSQLVSVAQARRLVAARRLAGAYVPGLQPAGGHRRYRRIALAGQRRRSSVPADSGGREPPAGGR